jgi:hypothetical protein
MFWELKQMWRLVRLTRRVLCYGGGGGSASILDQMYKHLELKSMRAVLNLQHACRRGV